jgi:hypothetical protein
MMKTSGRKGKQVKGFGTLADVIPAGMLEPGDIDTVVEHHTPDGPWRKGKVGMFWLSLLGTVFPKETHPNAINPKDSAMLWQVLTGHGGGHDEAGMTGQDLANLLLYWQKFADEVGFREGIKPAMRPSIGFLAKYKHIAVDMRDTLAGLRSKANKPPTGTAPVQLIAQPSQIRDNTNIGKGVKGVKSKEKATPVPESDEMEHFALDGKKVVKW